MFGFVFSGGYYQFILVQDNFADGGFEDALVHYLHIR